MAELLPTEVVTLFDTIGRLYFSIILKAYLGCNFTASVTTYLIR